MPTLPRWRNTAGRLGCSEPWVPPGSSSRAWSSPRPPSRGAAAAILGTARGWAATLGFLAVARTQLGLGAGVPAGAQPWLPLVVASLAGLALWPLLGAVAALAAAHQAARLPVIEILAEA